MLHVCVQRFDVTKNLENFYKILGTKQALGVLSLELLSLSACLVAQTLEFGLR